MLRVENEESREHQEISGESDSNSDLESDLATFRFGCVSSTCVHNMKFVPPAACN